MLKVDSMTDTSGMPRLHASGSSANQLSDKGKEEDKIWTRILCEVSAKSGNGMQSSVIVLGDHKCGNHLLMEKLEKEKAEKTGRGVSALEYHTLHVQADFRDGSYAYQLGTAGGAMGPAESFTLPVWLVDGDETFSPLVSHALPPSPSRAVVILTAAIDNPGLVHSLRRWANVVAAQMTLKYDKATIAEARQTQERFWQEYVEPVESSMTASIMQSMEDPMVVPLEQGVLSENTGASLIVVITKSDLAGDMQTHQWERIMVQVRRFCLAHGAAVFYVSAKKGHNVQNLYKYIIHRAYGFGFTAGAQMIERESVFVPAGWDSEKKIDIIKETVGDVDTLEPTREKAPIKLVQNGEALQEQLIEAEEEQAFLGRLSAMEVAPTPKKATVVMEDLAPTGADSSNTALASFFSNLLSKPGQPGSKSPQSAAAAASAGPPLDAAAQLDRIRSSVAGAAASPAKDSSA